MVNDFLQYAMTGSSLAVGLEPVSELPGFVEHTPLRPGQHGPQLSSPSTFWRFGRGSQVFERGGKAIIPKMPNASSLGLQAFTGSFEDYALGLGAGLQGGFAAIDISRGYQEGGIYGATERANFQMATNAAIGKWAYTSKVGMAGATSARVMTTGMGSLIGRGIGAAIGGAIGESFLGMPGAWIGAYIGGAPIQAMGVPGVAPALMISTPFVIASALKVAGYKAAYRLGKAGHAHRQYQQRIDTDGSLAAFMTNNANTMRAKAVQAIRRSHSNSRSALGQEATLLALNHNYFSSYR